ncbi:hypothetical protein C6H65_20405 [Photorhabdus luminescens]|nr:hypothetical protein C6H65_20405 [Photorhabdus luminescens]
MFKKLLTVGALAAALIGGVGTASAFSGYENCVNDQGFSNGKPVRSVVHAEDRFADRFNEGNGVTWRLKKSRYCGNGLYVAYYEGDIDR